MTDGAKGRRRPAAAPQRGPGAARAEDSGALDAPTAALVRAAAAIAAGDAGELKVRFAAARERGTPTLWIEELLLQSLLVVGYPLALVAFGVWRELTGPLPQQGDGAEQLAHADWESWEERGAVVCREVYGRAYHKLLVNLRALHPALEDLVLVDAYGKVIGRSGLDLQRRELCTVAAVAVLGTMAQLHSHLRGALNTGASVGEVEAVLALLADDLTPALRRRTEAQWHDVRGRRLK